MWLSQLSGAGLPILPGFIVTSSSFDAFLSHNHLIEPIEDLLSTCSPKDTQKLHRTSDHIQKLILEGRFPEDVSSHILRSFTKIGRERVMCFPSFAAQNSGEIMYANSEKRFFGIRGDANLFMAIRSLWAQYFDPKSLYYRLKHKHDHFSLPFSLIIQEHPEFALTGELLTTDPHATTKQTSRVQVVFGEGGLIGEYAGADYIWISMVTRTKLKTVASAQSTSLHFGVGKIERYAIPPKRQRQQKLTKQHIEQIATLSHRLQQTIFFPHMCTIGIEGKHIWIVDIAPLSSLPTPTIPVRRHEKRTPVPAEPASFARGVTIDLANWKKKKDGHWDSVVVNPTTHIKLNGLHPALPKHHKILAYSLYEALLHIEQEYAPTGGIVYSFSHLQPEEYRMLKGAPASTPDASGAAAFLQWPELFTPELHALQLFRRKYPHVPMTLTIPYVRSVHEFGSWQQKLAALGWRRSSLTKIALTVSVPSIYRTLSSCIDNGLDSILLDTPELTRHLFGKEMREYETYESEVISVVEDVVRVCAHRGVALLLRVPPDLEVAIHTKLNSAPHGYLTMVS